jgi:hypothetical protein
LVDPRFGLGYEPPEVEPPGPPDGNGGVDVDPVEPEDPVEDDDPVELLELVAVLEGSELVADFVVGFAVAVGVGFVE